MTETQNKDMDNYLPYNETIILSSSSGASVSGENQTIDESSLYIDGTSEINDISTFADDDVFGANTTLSGDLLMGAGQITHQIQTNFTSNVIITTTGSLILNNTSIATSATTGALQIAGVYWHQVVLILHPQQLAHYNSRVVQQLEGI